MPVTPTPTVALPPRRVTDDVMIDIISHVPDKRTPISFFLYDTADTESVSFTNQVVAQLRRLGYQRVAVDGSMVGGAPKERYFSYNVLPGNVIGILVYKNEQPTY